MITANERKRIAISAFWFLRLLDTDLDTAAFKQTLLRILRAEDVLAVVKLALPERFDSMKDLEMWWAVGCHQMTLNMQLLHSTPSISKMK